MSVKNIVLAIPLTSIDSATFTGVYQPINPNGLDRPCFLIRITNDSNVDVTISGNGTTDNDFIRAGETLQLNFQTNSQPGNYVANLAKGTIIYVKGSAGVGNSGSIYLAGYFQPVI
jgi:hypothetical protein